MGDYNFKLQDDKSISKSGYILSELKKMAVINKPEKPDFRGKNVG